MTKIAHEADLDPTSFAALVSLLIIVVVTIAVACAYPPGIGATHRQWPGVVPATATGYLPPQPQQCWSQQHPSQRTVMWLLLPRA